MSAQKVTFSHDNNEDSSVYVTYGDEPTRPLAIEDLADFPKIQQLVHNEWGTMRLKKYLGKLLADTRENTRNGFPDETAEALLNLAIANIAYLEKIGFNLDDDPTSEFALTGWELPKNF